MKLIGNLDTLKRDAFAYRIYDKLNTILAKDEESLLYYMFPIYSGNIDIGKIQATLLLLSPLYGIFYFDTIKSNEDAEGAQQRINELYECIAACFRKVSALKAGRNSLKHDVTTVLVTEAPVNVSDEFSNTTFDNLKQVFDGGKNSIGKNDFDLIQSCLEGTAQAKQKINRKVSSIKKTRGSILNEIESHIARFDLEQKQAALADIDGPQRIRGLAGSGKTIVLTQKAALYHLNHPNDKILYTYYTKSLHDTIKEHISRAYRYFSDNKEPNWDNIFICHAWGSSATDGTYSMACQDNSGTILNFSNAISINREDPLGGICTHLMKEVVIKPKYDLILIDEGQDFTSPFYQLCYRLSHNKKKIVWAYDDFQNIFDVKIQNERETFGKDDNGNYLVDFEKTKLSNQDIVLKKCYRTPRLQLIAAFSLGLGIYNSKILQRLDSNDYWQSLGFNVLQGNCHTGDDMIIERPEENTPSYSNENFKNGSILYNRFQNFEQECSSIAKDITKDITEENLRPEDICVICLDRKNVSSYFLKIERYLLRNGIGTFNLLSTYSGNLSFTKENCVTLTTVNKAKGNEKGSVYICGTDYIFSNPNNVVLRDILFTAMTRTKGWLSISGCTEDFERCISEMMQLKSKAFKLCFKQPSQLETKTIESHSRIQTSIFEGIGKNFEKLKKTGLTEKDIIKQIKRLLKDDG